MDASTSAGDKSFLELDKNGPLVELTASDTPATTETRKKEAEATGDRLLDDPQSRFGCQETPRAAVDNGEAEQLGAMIPSAEDSHRVWRSSHDDALESLARGQPLEDVLAALISAFELVNPDMIGSILLLEQDRLWHGVAPRLPIFFTEAIDGLQIGPQVGSCGTAAFTGQRVVVDDVMTHPYWHPYRALAARANIRACWSEPIKSSTGEVLGTFAIYFSEPREPQPPDFELMRPAAQLAAIAIERNSSARNLVQTQTDYERYARQGSEELALVQEEMRNVADRKLERIGQLIHDEVGQQLTGLGYLAGSLYEDACDGKPADADEMKKLVKGIELAMQSLREVSRGLMPYSIMATNLSDCLQALAADCHERFGIECEFRCSRPVQVDLEETNIQLSLIAKEAINNAVKYAKADRISVRLLGGTENTVLEVEDDGIGFEVDHDRPQAVPRLGRQSAGLGLLIMRDRAKKCGMRLEINSTPGSGTLIRCIVQNG